jgi:hypothetical protein
MNIKMYEKWDRVKIVSPDIKYKSDKYYNKEGKESSINNNFCEF